jgi:hypothetical protein
MWRVQSSVLQSDVPRPCISTGLGTAPLSSGSHSFTVDPSNESEWAILLQHVASYVCSSEQVPLESYANEIISHAIPALDGVNLRSLDYETPMAASMTEMLRTNWGKFEGFRDSRGHK